MNGRDLEHPQSRALIKAVAAPLDRSFTIPETSSSNYARNLLATAETTESIMNVSVVYI